MMEKKFKTQLMLNLSNLNEAKTTNEIVRIVNRAYNYSEIKKGKEEKYIDILRNCLMKSKSKDASLKYVYNYIVSSEGMAMADKTIEKKNWFKGTAIGGMECSNSYR